MQGNVQTQFLLPTYWLLLPAVLKQEVNDYKYKHGLQKTRAWFLVLVSGRSGGQPEVFWLSGSFSTRP